MGDLKRYDVTVNGRETTMQLNDEDAKAYGDSAKPVDDAAAPSSVEPAADADATPDASADASSKAAKAPANKARTGQNKAADAV